MDDIRIPSKWNTWKVIEYIGDGAGSEVYYVRDRISGRDAALKIITVDKSSLVEEAFIRETGLGNMVKSMSSMDEAFFRKKIEKARQEIELLYSLKGHKNIVTIYDHEIAVEEDYATIYILMEYLTDLWSWFNMHPLSEEAVVDLGKQIASALEYCEGKHIFHQDIKPENILVAKDGTYKLTDFSVSNVQENEGRVAFPQGTLLYMAPECIKGKDYTKVSEVYALGLVLYQLSNQKCLPFMDQTKGIFLEEDFKQTIELRCSGADFIMPTEVSEKLGKIILKACSFDEKDRYSSVAELRKALETCEGKPVEVKAVKKEDKGKEASRQKIKKNERSVAEQKSKKTEKSVDDQEGKKKEKEDSEQKPRKKSSKILGLVIGIVALVAVGGAGILISGSIKSKEDTSQAANDVQQEISENSSENEKTVLSESLMEDESQEADAETDQEEGTQQDSKSDRSFPQKDKYQVGDYIFDKDVKVSYISSGIYESENKYLQPGEGNQYVFMEFILENLSDTDIHESNFADYSCTADGDYCSGFKLGTIDTAEIMPGRAFKVVLVYEVPADAGVIELEYSPDHDLAMDAIFFAYEGENTSEYTEEEHRVSTENAIPVGTAKELENISVTVADVSTEAETANGADIREGYHPVSVTYHIENTGEDSYIFNPYEFAMYGDGYYYNYLTGPTDLNGTISKGSALDRIVVYEVPDDTACLEVDYFEKNSIFGSFYKCTFSILNNE